MSESLHWDFILAKNLFINKPIEERLAPWVVLEVIAPRSVNRVMEALVQVPMPNNLSFLKRVRRLDNSIIQTSEGETKGPIFQILGAPLSNLSFNVEKLQSGDCHSYLESIRKVDINDSEHDALSRAVASLSSIVYRLQIRNIPMAPHSERKDFEREIVEYWPMMWAPRSAALCGPLERDFRLSNAEKEYFLRGMHMAVRSGMEGAAQGFGNPVDPIPKGCAILIPNPDLPLADEACPSVSELQRYDDSYFFSVRGCGFAQSHLLSSGLVNPYKSAVMIAAEQVARVDRAVAVAWSEKKKSLGEPENSDSYLSIRASLAAAGTAAEVPPRRAENPEDRRAAAAARRAERARDLPSGQIFSDFDELYRLEKKGGKRRKVLFAVSEGGRSGTEDPTSPTPVTGEMKGTVVGVVDTAPDDIVLSKYTITISEQSPLGNPSPSPSSVAAGESAEETSESVATSESSGASSHLQPISNARTEANSTLSQEDAQSTYSPSVQSQFDVENGNISKRITVRLSPEQVDSALPPDAPYICTGCDAFLTEEPDAMDAMALVHCRVKRVIVLNPSLEGALLGRFGGPFKCNTRLGGPHPDSTAKEASLGNLQGQTPGNTEKSGKTGVECGLIDSSLLAGTSSQSAEIDPAHSKGSNEESQGGFTNIDVRSKVLLAAISNVEERFDSNRFDNLMLQEVKALNHHYTVWRIVPSVYPVN